jgi:hypothetical protein
MLNEMIVIEANGTWQLKEASTGHRPIGLKWVFKMKKMQLATSSTHKTRLVTRGFVQQQGMDFDELFVPVARLESIQL